MLRIDINLLFTVINLLVLYLLLRKFLFKPLQNVQKKRQAKIDGDFAAAKNAKDDAKSLKANYEKSMADVEEKRKQILADANAQAQAIVAAKEKEATEAAEALMASTRKKLAEERAMAERQAQEAIAGLALAAARKALESGEPLTEDRHAVR